MLKNNLKKHDRNQLYYKITLTIFIIFTFMFANFFKNYVSIKNKILIKNQLIKKQKKIK